MNDMLAVSIESVTADIREMVTTGKYPVVMLLRGYGLLELLEDHFSSRCGDCEVIGNALSEYKRVYEEYGEKLEEMLDREIIKSKAEAYMRPWQRKLDEAQKAYKKSVELWEAAKAAHQAQEEGGIVERWRTLKAVRRLAGFRLERRRTGNFVARTSELMRQAQMAAREAELQLYEHNVEYKCNPALYRKIYDMIIENCN